MWTRRNGFERAQLTRALERRSVVQGTLMRGTIHIVPARDYWAIANAIGEDGRAWWLRATRRQFPEEQVAALATELRGLLADGPRGRKELIAELGVSSTLWNGLGGWVNLLRVPPSGTWERRSADIYAVAEDWLGASPNVTRDDGVESARAAVPDRLRSRVAQGHRELGGHLHDHARSGAGPDDAPTVPGRARR